MPSPDTALTSRISLPDDQPLRRAVRRLRWFKSTFDRQLETITSDTGITYHLNTPKLTRCFIHWLEAFEAQKPERTDQRQAYIGFASGLMLRQLIEDQPLAAGRLPDHANPELPACFWPEGFAYVMYCLNVRRAVMKEEFGEDFSLSPVVTEIRTWHSFKENVSEDSSAALGFLDLFAGIEPDWSMPAIFKGSRRTMPGIEAREFGSLTGGKGYLSNPE